MLIISTMCPWKSRASLLPYCRWTTVNSGSRRGDMDPTSSPGSGIHEAKLNFLTQEVTIRLEAKEQRDHLSFPHPESYSFLWLPNLTLCSRQTSSPTVHPAFPIYPIIITVLPPLPPPGQPTASIPVSGLHHDTAQIANYSSNSPPCSPLPFEWC